MKNEQLVRSLFELFGRRELDQAVALFAEAAEFQVPRSNAISGTYQGRAGVLEFWRRQIDLSGGSFRTQVVSLEPMGDDVVSTSISPRCWTGCPFRGGGLSPIGSPTA
jgi:ketosteroid isomerase-like protein